MLGGAAEPADCFAFRRARFCFFRRPENSAGRARFRRRGRPSPPSVGAARRMPFQPLGRAELLEKRSLQRAVESTPARSACGCDRDSGVCSESMGPCCMPRAIKIVTAAQTRITRCDRGRRDAAGVLCRWALPFFSPSSGADAKSTLPIVGANCIAGEEARDGGESTTPFGAIDGGHAQFPPDAAARYRPTRKTALGSPREDFDNSDGFFARRARERR